jgi:hypothetical protein
MTDKESEGFTSLIKKFPKLSMAKMKGGIFFGPQIKNCSKTKMLLKKIKLYRKNEHGKHSKDSAETV